MKKEWFYVSLHGVENEFERIIQSERNALPQWTSCLGGFETEAELRLNVELADFKCCKCGGLVGLSFINKDELLEHKMCFKCNCYREVKAIMLRERNRVIINGNSYHIREDVQGAGFKGFGGRAFSIERFDEPGYVITTHNLWHQGEIPKVWKEEIPDNAKFVIE